MKRPHDHPRTHRPRTQRPGWLDPRWYAAALVVSVAGAVGGAAIGTTPVIERGEGATPPDPYEPGPGEIARDRGEPLPDHYPLVTPTGTVPVAELALHGRLRSLRQGRWDAAAAVPLDAPYPDQLDEAAIDRLAEGPSGPHPDWRRHGADRGPQSAPRPERPAHRTAAEEPDRGPAAPTEWAGAASSLPGATTAAGSPSAAPPPASPSVAAAPADRMQSSTAR